ncbi:hypothetical protein GYMLUDRAFT_241988 [Collybiopsis luxurians FD-317 M1]|uniref:Uncharacterized protein n=1 Tax=Collybiopsis luxurians FD-317 M1 TaxID=944289 RepID=A0A0D0D2U4_9AGAR|nr:hypothetical protein GYMLUDRAFT_241988 [Collybiopsis luxurians FD-317 M1]
MDTGSGKTHITVLHLKHKGERKLEKLSWFLAPTAALCEQQCNVTKDTLHVSVGLILGVTSTSSLLPLSATARHEVLALYNELPFNNVEMSTTTERPRVTKVRLPSQPTRYSPEEGEVVPKMQSQAGPSSRPADNNSIVGYGQASNEPLVLSTRPRKAAESSGKGKDHEQPPVDEVGPDNSVSNVDGSRPKSSTESHFSTASEIK